MSVKLRIGSRKTELAMAQTKLVSQRLQQLYDDIDIDIVGIATTGDKILDVALHKIGEKNLFLKELECALQEGVVDLVVHSLKDVPTSLPAGMTLGAICQRDSPYDAVVMRSDLSYHNLASLPDGSIVGTSSVRRTAQLRAHYPRLVFRSVRGSLLLRLRKLDTGCGEQQYSALVLAAAGLNRLGLSHRIATVLADDVCMYAVGQGALAVECLSASARVLALVAPLCDRSTALHCVAERALMRRLDGGCSVPVAVHSSLTAPNTATATAATAIATATAAGITATATAAGCDGGGCDSHCGDILELRACVASVDGERQLKMSARVALCDCASVRQMAPPAGDNDDVTRQFVGLTSCRWRKQLAAAEQLGESLASSMLGKGAGEILESARSHSASVD